MKCKNKFCKKQSLDGEIYCIGCQDAMDEAMLEARSEEEEDGLD